MPELSRLVAHRGDPSVRPENTLPAVAAAIAAGAHFVEFDVQLSSDHVPVLMHDAELLRTTGSPGSVMDLPAAQLVRLRADTQGPSCSEARIPLLSELCDLLNGSPQVTAFVEIKRESLERFGTETTVYAVTRVLRDARFPWIIISFDREAIEQARMRFDAAIGWVLNQYDAASLKRARSLAPAYLFCDAKKLPEGKIERGPFTWVIYDISTLEEADDILWRGANLIETSCITRLARKLKSRAL